MVNRCVGYAIAFVAFFIRQDANYAPEKKTPRVNTRGVLVGLVKGWL
jgi:hypothetical protein